MLFITYCWHVVSKNEYSNRCNFYLIMWNAHCFVRAAWLSDYELRLTREVAGSNPGKGHWWTTGRASRSKNAHCSSKVPTNNWAPS